MGNEVRCGACGWIGPPDHLHACLLAPSAAAARALRERRERYALAYLAGAGEAAVSVSPERFASWSLEFADELIRLLDEPAQEVGR